MLKLRLEKQNSDLLLHKERKEKEALKQSLKKEMKHSERLLEKSQQLKKEKRELHKEKKELHRETKVLEKEKKALNKALQQETRESSQLASSLSKEKEEVKRVKKILEGERRKVYARQTAPSSGKTKSSSNTLSLFARATKQIKQVHLVTFGVTMV